MTTLHTRGRPFDVRRSALWRAARATARALRHIHDEQMYMWECILQASRVPVDQPGPLAWEPSLDGAHLGRRASKDHLGHVTKGGQDDVP